MRVLRFLLRSLGWLLTPLVAWAASFFGAWAFAGLARLVADSSFGLVMALGGGALGAVSATVFWMRLLRRSPELRQVLQVTEQGVPVAAVEGGDDAAPARPGESQPQGGS